MLRAPTPFPELGRSECIDSEEEISSHVCAKHDGLGLDVVTAEVY